MKTLLLSTFLLIGTCLSAQELLKVKVKNRGGSVVSFSNGDDYLGINSNKDLVIYNAGSNVQIKTFKGFSKDITSIAFNSDDSEVMASSADGKIKLWNVLEGRLISTINHGRGIIKASFIDDKTIAYISEKEAVVYNIEERKPLWSKSVANKPLRAMVVGQSVDMIAVGGGDKTIHLLDLNNGVELKTLKYHSDWIRSLAFHPYKPQLASGSDNGQVVMWNISTGQITNFVDEVPSRVYGLKFSNDASVLSYSADKAYFYSMEKQYKVLELSGFSAMITSLDISPSGKELVTQEDFVGSFKIWDVSGLNIQRIYKLRDETDKTPPQIYVSNPVNIKNDRVRTAADVMQLRGTVIDDSGVRSLKINNIETPIKESGNYILNLPLTPGENYVTMEVTDINDNISLKKFLIERRDIDGTEYSADEAKNFLFIVGINNYQFWPKLNNAVKDASDVAQVLLSKYRFNFEDIIILKDEQATRTNIINSLRGLIEKVTPKDNLMIYYSGHGYFDDLLNEGYWVPVDAPKNSLGDYIPNSSTLKILENIDTQHTFLVADACFSGSLFSSTTRGYVENVEKFKSRWGLASGRLEVVSDGQQGTNSPFAGHFIDYLRNNKKPSFAVSELVQYVKVKTAEDSDQTPLGNPLKSLGDEGGEFIFYKKD